MERGTFRRRIGEHELVRRGRLAATAPRHDVKGKFRIQVRTTRNQTKLGRLLSAGFGRTFPLNQLRRG